MSYEIQKNIPLAPKATMENNMPFLQMEPGDSFLVPIKDHSPATVHAALDRYRLRNPDWKWTARIVKKENGIRVWCLECPPATIKKEEAP